MGLYNAGSRIDLHRDGEAKKETNESWKKQEIIDKGLNLFNLFHR